MWSKEPVKHVTNDKTEMSASVERDRKFQCHCCLYCQARPDVCFPVIFHFVVSSLHFCLFLLLSEVLLSGDPLYEFLFLTWCLLGIEPSLPIQHSGNIALRKAQMLSAQWAGALVCLIAKEMQYRPFRFLRQRWTRRESVHVYFIRVEFKCYY